jgi:hypothetical protein
MNAVTRAALKDFIQEVEQLAIAVRLDTGEEQCSALIGAGEKLKHALDQEEPTKPVRKPTYPAM